MPFKVVRPSADTCPIVQTFDGDILDTYAAHVKLKPVSVEYCSGFFAGKGNVEVDEGGTRLQIRASSSHYWTLVGMRERLGGRVNANYPRAGKRPSWIWLVTARPDALKAIDRLLTTSIRDQKQRQLEIARDLLTRTLRADRRKALYREFKRLKMRSR